MASRIALKDTQREQRIYSARSATALLFVVALLAVLLGRYYSLQISDFETYSTASERNRVQLQPLPPKRGLIFDRNGVLLADNRPSYTLSLIIERVDDVDATVATLAEIIDVSEEDIEKFITQACYRVSDFIFRMQDEESDWGHASDALREEPALE